MGNAPELSLAEQWSKGHKWHASQAGLRVETAKKCLRLIQPFVSFENVADFGCGIGAWLAAAKALGAAEITGFEGEWVESSDVIISREDIKIVDLGAALLKFERKFTLAMTIEVAEHLPPKSADGFVSTLTNASDFILFSAAIPGQGGSGHVNEQPLPYWVQKFWRKGFIPLEPIRPYIARDESIFFWIRQNIVMFVNYDIVIRTPEALRFARPISDFSLSYDPARKLGTY